MTFQVVTQKASPQLTFPALFERTTPPGHVVILGSVVDEADLLHFPVKVSLGDRRLQVDAFGGTFALDVITLVEMGSTAGGYAHFSVPNGADGGQLLEGLGQALRREVPPPRERKGPIERVRVGLSSTMSESGLTLQVTTGSLGLRITIPSANEPSADLAISTTEVDEAWDDFATFWARKFRDGREPRLTQDEDSLLADNAPWIASTAPLPNANKADLSEAAFGSETLFAVAADEETSTLLAWFPPYASPPIALTNFPKADTGVYPSPDGKWVVLRATVPDEQGSLTDGVSSLLLVSVGDGGVRTLCRKDLSLVFGDTAGIISWSADARRFAFSAKTCVRNDEGQSAQFIYDVDAGAFVDVCQNDLLADEWQGNTLYLKKLEIREDEYVYHWFRWIPGADPEPCEAPASRSPDNRFEIRDDDPLTVCDLLAEPARGTRTAALDRASSFDTFWAGSFLVDGGVDARVLDLHQLTWRYLALRGTGEPKKFAELGRTVLFQGDDGWTIGSGETPSPVSPRIEWPTTKPERIAVASAHAGDLERAKGAAESAGGATTEAVADILRHRGAAEAFGRGLEAEDAAEERDAFAEAVRLDPEWSDAHHNLTLACRRAGDFDEMLSAAEAWSRRFPNLAEAHVDRSIALQNLGRSADAVAAAREAIRLSPDVSAAHYQHACALAKAGQTSDAVAAAQKAADLDSTSIVAIGLDDDLEALRGSPGFARFEAAAQLYRAQNAKDACEGA